LSDGGKKKYIKIFGSFTEPFSLLKITTTTAITVIIIIIIVIIAKNIVQSVWILDVPCMLWVCKNIPALFPGRMM